MWRWLSGWRLSSLWRLARVVGPGVKLLSRRERDVTLINLAQAYPELDHRQRHQLARDSLIHSSASMLELGFAWMGPADSIEAAIIDVRGRELLDEARQQGRGVIVLAPHFGNWEVLNFWLSSHFPFTAMYEPPKIHALDAVTRHGRERRGASLVPTNPRGVASLLKALKRSETIGILPDQEPDWGSGVFAPFFSRDAYTATLLPKLVARTEARVVTGVALRQPGHGFVIHFQAADERVYSDDETISATGVNACVEGVIKLDPAQYQWEYKRYRKTYQEQISQPDYKRYRLY